MEIFSIIKALTLNLLLITILSSSSVSFAKPPVKPDPEPEPTPIGSTFLLSLSSDGIQGNNNSHNHDLTPDGRFSVFSSTADNLVAGDTNALGDIFVHDRVTGLTERVSVASDGTQADDSSYDAALSADGRYVAFYSRANNLVAGEQTYFSQVYVHDRLNHITERVSIASDGTLANWSSNSIGINADGRYVTFSSFATNLVSGADANGTVADVYVHDRLNGVTERISVASDGTQANQRSAGASFSADGQVMAFLSSASNLVAGDTNGVMDIFVRDRRSGITERVSLASDGTQGNKYSSGPSISADGLVVTFNSNASNLVNNDTNNYTDIFVHDRTTSVTERVSVSSSGTQANDQSFSPSASFDGRYISYLSFANNLTPENADWWYPDIFLFDRVTRKTELISLSTEGVQANLDSGAPVISGDGRFVSFDSYAPELILNENGLGHNDVFIRDRLIQ